MCMASTTTPGTSKQALLRRIAQGYRALRSSLEALPRERFGEKLSTGWSLNENLLHLSAWEETVPPRVAGVLSRGEDPKLYDEIDSFNARVAAESRGKSTDELFARWSAAHERVLETVRQLSDDAPPLAFDVVEWNTTNHYPDHFADIGAAVRNAADLVRLIQTNWLPFRLGLLSLGLAALEQTTSTGWTYKDLAAHAAAWEERTATRLAVFRESGEGMAGVDDTDPFNADVPRICPTSTLRTAAKSRRGSRALRRRSYGGSMPHTARSSTRSRRCRLTRTSISWPFDSSAARRTATSRSICGSSSPRFPRTPVRSSRGSMTSGGASAPGSASAAAADSARRRPRAGPTRTSARTRRRGCRKPCASSPRTSSPTGTRARSRSSTTARSRRIASSVRRRCSMSSTRLPGGCARRSLRFRTSASRTRKSSTSSRGAPTSTGKTTSPSLGSTFETADPRGHGEGRSRRPRPRREGGGARVARRRHGGDLHRRASNAGTGRRDRAAGGCRCHRRIAPVRSPQLHLSADRRAHEGKRNG